MNEMNEMNQNTSASGMTSGVDQHRPFPCDQCSKLFTRSENLQRHKRAQNQIFMLYKVTAVLRARIFSVADVMLDSLEGLVSIFILAMHCNNTNNFAATCINDMVIVAARQDPQSRYLSRRCRGRAMGGVPSPLTTTRNPTERVVTDEAFWEEHSTFATELPQSFSSSSPRYACLP
ncbi:uncharacterized protein N7487_004892 [Penicillium crustosum]|uniref:uncharacterized protein n=1 Tax=Penicillium crustosum TaxID=36656 RepID=UPI002384CFA7|nr:uncharacterized protein N7487_004892 [Penicillium crustosum]KAJ5410533.1 hypothetical protein N7487_004892 [Penicillium crustosum]